MSISNQLRPIIKNYPNLNATFKAELESYGLYIVDSVFNQIKPEKNN